MTLYFFRICIYLKFNYILNVILFNFNKKEILTCLPETFIDEAVKSITGWNGYRPTPLIKLNKLNKQLNDSFYIFSYF